MNLNYAPKRISKAVNYRGEGDERRRRRTSLPMTGSDLDAEWGRRNVVRPLRLRVDATRFGRTN